MPKHVILFLAASPHGTNARKLGEECAEIQRELKMTPHRDDFRFESRWAVSIDELMRHLMELEPTVIHFSGHGGGSAGLLLQDEQGQPQPVSARTLAMMVEAAARKARVVVLNACHTTVQADTLRTKVDCVVGMSGAIGDVAARAFAMRFYGALGNRRSIANAVAQGIAALAAKQLPDEVLPRCVTRDGLQADQVVLAPIVAPPLDAAGTGPRDFLPVAVQSPSLGTDMFIGRDREMSEIESLLARSDDVQLRAALDGLPGIGKTELARQVVARLSRGKSFPGGIFWFTAEQPDLRLQWAKIAEDLGAPVLREFDERAAWAVRHVEHRAQRGDQILIGVADLGEVLYGGEVCGGEQRGEKATAPLAWESSIASAGRTRVSLARMTDEQDERCTLTPMDRDRLLRLPSLVVTVTPPQGLAVEAELAMRPLIVGTSPDVDLVVADPQVSRRHCELQLTGEGIVLRDLGSKNGTRVGKVLIREALLPPSVPVTLGGSELVVHTKGEPTLVPMSLASSFGGAIGQSFSMRTLFAKLERAAASDHTILLLGESGTGKEVFARAIHDNSPKKGGPFVVFDCGSVSPSLVEAELFGNVKGAFTGADKPRAGLVEEANGGTLFLDEIGELPLDLQPKLLRALEARQTRRIGANEWRPFDARIVAATHRNLRARASEGSFREDLYYRLAVVEIHVPALRERKEDIPSLVERFLAAHAPPRALTDLPPHTLDLLAAHDWPGNVRELRNMVARLVLFPERIDELIGPMERASLAAAPPGDSEPESGPPEEAKRLGPLLSLPLQEARELWMEPFERSYVTVKLREHKGNISHAADAMGVSRQVVHRLLDRYGLKAK